MADGTTNLAGIAIPSTDPVFLAYRLLPAAVWLPLIIRALLCPPLVRQTDPS
jgi:hypothetical protein